MRTKGSGDGAQFLTCFKSGKNGDYRSDCTEGKKVEAKEEPKGMSYWVTFIFPSVSTENIRSAKTGNPQVREHVCPVSEDALNMNKFKMTRSAWVNGRPAKMTLDTASTCNE